MRSLKGSIQCHRCHSRANSDNIERRRSVLSRNNFTDATQLHPGGVTAIPSYHECEATKVSGRGLGIALGIALGFVGNTFSTPVLAGLPQR
jgi:hypothetical protein